MSKEIFGLILLTIIIFIVLNSTVFYEEPSCVSSNIDPIKIPVILGMSLILSNCILWSYEQLWKLITRESDGDDNNDSCF